VRLTRLRDLGRRRLRARGQQVHEVVADVLRGEPRRHVERRDELDAVLLADLAERDFLLGVGRQAEQTEPADRLDLLGLRRLAGLVEVRELLLGVHPERLGGVAVALEPALEELVGERRDLGDHRPGLLAGGCAGRRGTAAAAVGLAARGEPGHGDRRT
jgi:hypothetical protein